MTYQRITEETASSFIGADVQFNYGAMHGTEQGWVVGAQTTCWGTDLLAFTDSGQLKAISGFSSVGIGVHLLKLAEA